MIAWRRSWAGLLVRAVLLALLIVAITASRGVASVHQEAMFQDYGQLFADPAGTLLQMRLLGVQQLRLSMLWDQVAPAPESRRRPRRFREGDPGAYPTANWAMWDEIITDAQRDGIQVNLDVAGAAPLWATGAGAPHDGQFHHNWEPSPKDYGLFVHAVAERYSGDYDPDTGMLSPGDPADLPRVSFWSFWNEPNLGFMLAPQGVPDDLKVENSARLYRGILNAAWSALRRTGHRHDTTLIGELAPRGVNRWGVFSSMKPLVFLRALYCVDSQYRELRGAAATLRGCPPTATASRRFRKQNPALFKATGFADHMWMRWYPPNRDPQPDPDYSDLPAIGSLQRALDNVQTAYGSAKRFPIYNTEFGYITDPPNRSNAFISPTTSAYYLNWAEYISWRDPRIAGFDQYLLRDPPPTSSTYVGWSSGLLTFTGQEKPTYNAWRLPLYLPVQATRPNRRLEVWGCLRPAYFAIADTGLPQDAQLQFRPSSATQWTTIRTVRIALADNCYFDTRVRFPSSGTVRLRYIFPSNDPLLPQQQTVTSREIPVSIQ